MVERWTSADVRELLRNKYVVIIGDSIQRGVYKDLVYILQSNGYIDDRHLRAKGEKSCLGDELIEGGRFGEMHNGKNYREVRHYKCPSNYYMVTFYMVTACYSAYMETILRDLWNDPRPDIVIMNSCVWDITRYGPMSSVRYRENLQRLAKRMKTVLPDDCLFLWLTTTPLGKNVKGGFLLDQISFLSEVLRLDVLESNYYARQVMVDYEFDVLDMHFHFVKWINLRKADGIHWNPKAHRKMSNLIFDHLADAFGFPIPRIPHWGSANGEGVFMIDRNGRQKVNHTRSHTTSCDLRQLLGNAMMVQDSMGLEKSNFRHPIINPIVQDNYGFRHNSISQNDYIRHNSIGQGNWDFRNNSIGQDNYNFRPNSVADGSYGFRPNSIGHNHSDFTQDPIGSDNYDFTRDPIGPDNNFRQASRDSRNNNFRQELMAPNNVFADWSTSLGNVNVSLMIHIYF